MHIKSKLVDCKQVKIPIKGKDNVFEEPAGLKQKGFIPRKNKDTENIIMYLAS